MDKPSDLFSNMLIRRMEDAGLSHVELAERSGVPQANISRYRLKKSEPGLDAATAIAGAFGMTLDQFLVGMPIPERFVEKPTSVGEILLSHLPPETRRLIDLALKADPAAIRIATISLEGAISAENDESDVSHRTRPIKKR